MYTTGYRSDGVSLAVAVVNTQYPPRNKSTAALDDALRGYGFPPDRVTPRDRVGLRQWAHQLHDVFAAPDAMQAARQLNQLLDAVTTQPYITAHDDGALHLHYAPAEAAPLHRVQASTVMGLANLVCEYGVSRLGVCRASGCECVYVDVSRNAQRRFCSESCANRTNVAAFRARARQAAAAHKGATDGADAGDGSRHSTGPGQPGHRGS